MTSKEEIIQEIEAVRDVKRRVFIIHQALILLEKQRQMELVEASK
jgi:hypothetical protein